jgi:hypothetical protein
LQLRQLRARLAASRHRLVLLLLLLLDTSLTGGCMLTRLVAFEEHHACVLLLGVLRWMALGSRGRLQLPAEVSCLFGVGCCTLAVTEGLCVEELRETSSPCTPVVCSPRLLLTTNMWFVLLFLQVGSKQQGTLCGRLPSAC